MKTRWLLAAIAAVVIATPYSSAAEKSRGLDIYFADVEGGAATLIVTPTGESVLIDCGDRGNRDADRINKMARAQAAAGGSDRQCQEPWFLAKLRRLSLSRPWRLDLEHRIQAGAPDRQDRPGGRVSGDPSWPGDQQQPGRDQHRETARRHLQQRP